MIVEEEAAEEAQEAGWSKKNQKKAHGNVGKNTDTSKMRRGQVCSFVSVALVDRVGLR